MAMWNIVFRDRAAKELRKLSTTTQQDILRYLRERIATPNDPKRFGKGLSGDMAGLWRYRVQDYRIICQIDDHTITVLVLRISHRRDVYDQ